MRELDNPAWHALAGQQRQFGAVGERAARYLPDVSPIAGVAENSAAAFEELASLVAPGEFVAVVVPQADGAADSGREVAAEVGEQWRVATSVALSQWVCTGPPSFAPRPVSWTELGDEHAEAMYRLAKATDPGPFEARTHRLGSYVGVLAAGEAGACAAGGGQLVALAGERMCLPGYREVSAVCTHPDHVGRGYAQALVHEIVRRQRALGCVPFLHVRTGSPAEAQATRVYSKLGFVKHQERRMTILVRLE